MALVIIESHSKVKKFAGYTGYKVIATGGHFRNIPVKGMNINMETYEPVFAIMPGKEKDVANLKKMAKGQTVFLATDPSREGEAVAYFVEEEIRGLYKDIFRIDVREMTRLGISNALLRAIPFGGNKTGKFEAFLGRRVADRLVGYIESPKASRDLGIKGLSIGRVQTLVLGLVVEREREIREHRNSLYWQVAIKVAKDGIDFDAFHSHGRFEDKTKAQKVISKISDASYAVCKSVENITRHSNPRPPFTTASLQMAASSSLGVSPDKTMRIAQDLFEHGLITFPSTDSVLVVDEMVESIRNLITAEYGKEYVPGKPIKHINKKSQADLHQSIRPTSIFPLSVAKKWLMTEGLTTSNHILLYEMIWKRTVASQMCPATHETTTAVLEVDGEVFKGVGRVQLSDGFLRLYCGEENDLQQKDDNGQLMPFLSTNDLLAFRQEILVEKTSKTPGRYSEAGLIERLESLGIGRHQHMPLRSHQLQKEGTWSQRSRCSCQQV